MTGIELRPLLAKLRAVPSPVPLRSPAIERGIDDSVAYLGSDAALRSIESDVYWPKWHSPWWHMLLLHELGEARRIPARTSAAVVTGLNRLLHIFPIRSDEAPGADLQRDVACHCALGTMCMALAACGVDVGRALPWVKPWFLRYQMADGGLTCDQSAYLQANECPSSMVATVPPLEAMLVYTSWSRDERAFLDRAANFLIDRSLVQGSKTIHNADERSAALAWPRLTFPRFYFYDVLRGLAALVRWAEVTVQTLPAAAVGGVIEGLVDRWPDGVVRIERNAHAGRTTILPTVDRSAGPRVAATPFSLLDSASAMGGASEPLTRQWSETRAGLLRLAEAGTLAREG